MRMIVPVALGTLCAARLAAADPVDLLHAVPATIAVSSTVDNAKILPAHLVDGNLETAWNSRTNDLVGAWIAVRLPAGVKVASVKLTVGFTKQDKKLGDLFVENPRIKKVRVTHDKTVVDKVLDLDNRGVQEISISGEGGDYKVEVLEVAMGTKPTWREICVSEFSVWGTATAAKPTKPAVQIGSLEPVTPRDCVHALFPDATATKLADGDLVGRVDIYPAGGDRFLCHVRHGEKPDKTDDGIRTHELAIVTAKHKLLDGQVQELTHGGPQSLGDGGGNSVNVEDGDVIVTPVALTSGETAFEVDVTQGVSGPMTADSSTESTVYRVIGASLVPVLKFKSSESAGESSDADRCKLVVGKLPNTGKQLVPDLELHCTAMSGRFHGERANEIESKDRVERYRWSGGKYVKR